MSDLADVKRLHGYDRAVFDRFERAVKRLGWVKATSDHEIGHHSLKNTLVHILNVHEAWLVAVPAERWEVFEEPGRQPADVHSWQEYNGYKKRVRSRVDAALTGLTGAGLRRRVKAPWMPGIYTFEDGLHQVSYEQAQHLGEIIAVLWQSDRRPPPMTWIQNRPVVPAARRRPASRRARN